MARPRGESRPTNSLVQQGSKEVHADSVDWFLNPVMNECETSYSGMSAARERRLCLLPVQFINDRGASPKRSGMAGD